MRTRTGCQACRDRHIKCVKLKGSSKCQKCLETDRKCIQSAPHRFRPVTSVALKSDDDRTVKQDLTYDNSQVWVEIPSTVQFVATDSEADGEEEVPAEEPLLHYAPVAEAETSSHQSALVPLNSDQISPRPNQYENSPTIQRIDSRVSQQSSPHQQRTPIAGVNYTSPSQHSSHGRPNQFTSPAALASNPSPALSYSPSWPFASQHESRLFYHFIKDLSLWIDICDPQCHFGKEIPRRIPHHPILAYAMFALSSRQLSILNNTEDEESPHYVDQALKILISSLEDPLGHWDENLLAAIIILRLHEEIAQDDDQRCHLFGTRRILNAISSFAADGGLRETASWISLRQHIYISLTKQQPLEINLENFRHSSVFDDQSDEAWANRMIFIFAKVLDYAFQEGTADTPEPEAARWSEVEAEVEAWYMSKPWYFAPLWIETRGANSTPQSGYTRDNQVWPELLMSHPAQVVGLQYYYLAKIVLAIYNPQLTKLSFATHRARKQSEKTVIEGMRMIVGLSKSNEDVPNAMFQASHILSACGSYLNDPADQEGAVAFLGRIQQKMGWRTSKIVEDLRMQWHS